jgi:hypothetical protein
MRQRSREAIGAGDPSGLPDGESLALGPGDFFQIGTHTIDVKDGRLALVGAP